MMEKYFECKQSWEDLICQILNPICLLQNQIFRSDAQRSVKQKERKKQELERQVFNGDGYEEGGFPMSMVS